MFYKLLIKKLSSIGYIEFPLKINDYKVLFKPENNSVTVINLFDYYPMEQATHKAYEELINSVKEKFSKDTESEIHMFSLIIADSKEEARVLAENDYFCWFVDRKNMTLMDVENQAEDFYGLRSEIRKILDEIKELLAMGDLKAIKETLNDEQEAKLSRRKPVPFTIIMLVLNILMYLTYMVIGEPFLESTAIVVEKIQNGEIYRILTAMFMHGDITHLFSNMLLLFLFGELIENNIGLVRYGIIYMVSGLLGNVVSYVYNVLTNGGYYSLGASGAIFGLMGATFFLVFTKRENLKVSITRMVIMVVYCVYSSFVEAHIDVAAHIGGLLIGLLLAVVLCSKKGKTESEG